MTTTQVHQARQSVASTPTQLTQLTKRMLLGQLRNPAAVIPGLLIAVFFLLVYDGSLGGAGFLSSITGGSYVNFVLPVSIVSAAVSGSSAGLILVEDLESGFFRRQLAMPLARWTIVGAPVLVGALLVVLQTAVIIALGVVLGAQSATGFAGWVVIMLIAFLWGLAFAGYSVGAALRTGNAQAAQAATFLFFPLVFLTTTFVPIEVLKPWMQWAARINPTTYVLDGMRSVLIDGWKAGPLLAGFGAVMLFFSMTMAFAVVSARKATERA